jgi:hypothetical protein
MLVNWTADTLSALSTLSLVCLATSDCLWVRIVRLLRDDLKAIQFSKNDRQGRRYYESAVVEPIPSTCGERLLESSVGDTQLLSLG